MKWLELIAWFVVSFTASADVVFGPVWDLKFVASAAQQYASEKHVDVSIWRLPKDGPGEPVRWVAQTVNEAQPAGAKLEQTVHPR